jgi:hypothetical protein
MKKPETVIVKSVKDWLNKQEAFFFIKTHGSPFTVYGLPDLIGTINGRFVAIEIKRPETKNNTTTAQDYYLRRLDECNCIAFVACSLDEVKNIIFDYMKEGAFNLLNELKTSY